MNNSRIFSDTVKMTEWVKFNKKGEKTVTPRNEYLLSIADKALKTTIGANFVISKQWKNTTYDYMGIDNNSHAYEDLRNNLNESALLNLFTSINLFLTDRQLTLYYNKMEQLTVMVLKPNSTAKTIYIKDTEFGVETTRNAINDITGEEIRIPCKTVKSARVLIGDFIGDNAEELQALAKKDLNEIKRNIDNADLLSLCKPFAVKTDKKESVTA